METIKNTWLSVKGGWNGLSKAKRLGMGAILFSIVAIVIGLAYYTQKVDYAPLFSNLEEADAGTIVNDLKAKKIDYKLEDNGSTILIEQSQVDAYRIDLAVNDMLPQNSMGFEIFDATSMMATDEDRKIMYQRAVTGELERAISSLDSIESAKVLLSMPEDSVFTSQEDQAKASASVVLSPHNGQVPDDSAIQGIASLIAGAVDNLPKENIKIVDTKGNLLSAALQEDGSLNATDMVSKYQAIKTRYQEELEQKLRTTLGPIFGNDKLTVSVNVDLNFDAVENESIKYSKDPVKRSETVSAGGGKIDVAEGTDTDNAINEIVEGEGGTSSSYDRTTNYELDTETTNTVKAPGTINRLTTSVIIDGKLTNAEEEQVNDIVEKTIGIDTERGDLITVQGMEFAKAGDETETQTAPPVEIGATVKERLLKDWPYLAGGLAVLIVLIILLRIFRKKAAEEDELDFYEMEEPAVPVSVVRPAEPTAKEIEDKETADLKKELNRSMSEKEEKVRAYAKDNPEASADLIKIWMKDE